MFFCLKLTVMLEIRNLHVSADGKKVLFGIDLRVKKGEIHAVMGPNGSGKTSLSFAIMGHPKYKIEDGEIVFESKVINELKADERAKLGIFLAFQNPYEIPGVPLGKFLWSIAGSERKFAEFTKELKDKMKKLKIPDEFTKRELNKGFSGGEKKRTEILQSLILNPKLYILDEIDSGLDVDSLKVVSESIMDSMNAEKAIIIITHYPRILNYIKPNFVHVLFQGKIIMSGDFSLAKEIEDKGYEKILSGRIEVKRTEIEAKDVL
ncbi:MAG: Fe-S cluster assembly ATPase SufC [Candidatus Calescibacterium sp.]|nr:Fe-S cluster assembly ATPase SufC [Candidatus Calescibacterium sp.]MCX7733189.1 Fe-S cluster assembly ATPase SufC [bacterium]MDW8086897.1 Fe-S cluster assembly ATPase SufC [Candidatus Calescibacterium sp.]